MKKTITTLVAMLALVTTAYAWWWEWWGDYTPQAYASGSTYEVGAQASVEDTAYGWYRTEAHAWSNDCHGSMGWGGSGTALFTLTQDYLQDSYAAASNGDGGIIWTYTAVMWNTGSPNIYTSGGGLLSCASSGDVTSSGWVY